MNGKSFLLGYSVISSRAENAEKIINLCNEKAIQFSSVLIEGDSLRFCVPLFSEKRFFSVATERGIELTVISRKGIPALMLRHRRRVGILVGLFLSLLIFYFSSGLVWDIRIDGAVNISERELLATFERCGLCVGARLDKIDADVLENQILILSDDISWVSVNISKNVANVEIREREIAAPNEYGDSLYSNVVATQGGVIVGFEDVRGEIVVDIGEAVCDGQLLISGIMGDEGLPMRLTNAHGRVYAEVEETIEIKIPRKYIKKVTKESVKEEKSLIFFKNEIKFFTNSRNLTPFYDKIEVTENFYTINQKKLPIAIKTVKYIEYEEIEAVRSQSDMRSMAYIELYRYINENYSDSEILSRNLTIDERDEETVLACTLKCVKNIAEIQDIEIG